MRFKYKIEQWERRSGRTTFTAYVRGWLWGWQCLGSVDAHREAVELCRKHQKPRPGPWLYTAESIMSDGGL